MKRTNQSGGADTLKKCGLGAVVTAAVLAVLFIGFAAALTRIDVTKSTLEPLSTTLAAAGTAISGFFAAKIRKKSGLITGCAVGLLVFCAVLVGYMLTSDDKMTVQTLYKLVAFVASGALGGVFGIGGNKKSAAKYKAP